MTFQKTLKPKCLYQLNYLVMNYVHLKVTKTYTNMLKLQKIQLQAIKTDQYFTKFQPEITFLNLLFISKSEWKNKKFIINAIENKRSEVTLQLE